MWEENPYIWIGEYNPQTRQIIIDWFIQPRKCLISELIQKDLN